MADGLASLARYRADPASFIERHLIEPQTGAPFVLLPAERTFLRHAFTLNEDGKLRYSEWIYSCPKKSGKTTFAAIITLTMIFLFGGHYPEVTLAANDQEQAVGRVFEMCRRIIEASPLLKREAKITQDRIAFPAINATINAIPSSFAGAAGGNQNLTVFDELWAYTSERGSRLWDELPPPPTRPIAARLTVTYAGFEGEVAAARRPVPPRSVTAAHRRGPLRRKRAVDVLVAQADRTMADAPVDRGAAPIRAPFCLPAPDPQRVCPAHE